VKPLEAPASLRPWFWAGVLAVLAYEVVLPRTESGPVLLAGNAVAALSILPAGLWCVRRVYGLPLFPLFALAHLPTFAFPLISPTAEVARYSVETRLAAAGVAIAFLVVATALWYPLARRPGVPRQYRAFRRGDHNRLFLAFVWFGALFLFLNNAGWLPDLPSGTYAVFRNGSQGLAAIGSSVLAYRWGSRRLGPGVVVAFVVGFGLVLLLSAASLMIVLAVSNFAVVAAMYALGRGRIPVWVLIAAFLGFSVLHAGKHEMRKEYWTGRATLQPADYPAYYAEWVSRGLENLSRGETGRDPSSTSLGDRASLLQMLLLVLEKSPAEKPFLYGETYALVPELLVPRFLMSDKAVSHEGTYLLSIYYGRQTREDTRTTTIGFGLLAEAYANFGWPGMLGLGVFVGVGLGAVTRWSAATPIDSFRGLFALYVLGLSIATEHTLGVTAASLSQGTIMLLVVSALLMEPRHPKERP
jgi:hypothetical protein